MILTAGMNFAAAMRKEVRKRCDLLDQLRSLAQRGPITLVYSAHDEKHNDAVELRELILEAVGEI